MAQTTVEFEGRTIILDDTSTPPFLSIDGQVFQVSGGGDHFTTRRIAHAFFTSLLELAKALIRTKMV